MRMNLMRLTCKAFKFEAFHYQSVIRKLYTLIVICTSFNQIKLTCK